SHPAIVRRHLDVDWPLLGSPIKGTIVGSKIYGVLTHWQPKQGRIPGRTRPCLGDDHCEYCAAGQAKRWKGYLLYKRQTTGQLAIAMFTEAAAMSVYDRIYSTRPLRGCFLEL